MALGDIVNTIMGGPGATAPLDPNAILTPETLKRKRLLAEALAKEGTDYSPILSPWQGAARLANALVGGLEERRLDQQERAGIASANKALADILKSEYGGGATAAGGTASTGSTPSRALPTFARDVTGGINEATAKYGLDPSYLPTTAAIESNGNPAAANPNSSARGLFQFMPATARQYGLSNPLDPAASADAAARLALDNRKVLTAQLGREPTPAELYLAHQQGAGGAAKLLANPNARAADVVGLAAVQMNGGNPNMTAGEFANKWLAKYNSRSGGVQVASANPSFAPTGPGPMAYAAPQAPMTMPAPVQQAAQPQQPEAQPQPQEAAPPAGPGALPAMAGGGQQMQMPQHVASLQPEVAQRIVQTASNPQVQAAAQQTAQTPAGQQIARSAQGAPLASILTAMQNPWLTDGQKSILLMVAKEKLSGQYGFQTLPDGTIMRTDARRGTIEPIYQAPVKPVTLGADQRLVDPNTGKEVVGAAGGNTTDQKDYERAVKQGYKGTFMDYQIAMANAKRPVNKTEGTIPPGYRAVRDADGNIVSLELIPGSKEAKAEENQQKAGKQTADTVLDAVDRIDKRMNSTVFPSTGGFGNVLSSIPGTAAHDVSNLVETLKSNISIDQLNRMRQMSPTGGALGSVTEGEHRLLAASVASLAQSQSAQQFKENLARVRQRYLEIVHGQKAGAGARQNDPLGIR